ncbi:hypothetical protein OG21DRAFT_1263775 [Imleria badia]|nr:hypothetical protein OG21DRAFT_1263775 [Imleria badia]
MSESRRLYTATEPPYLTNISLPESFVLLLAIYPTFKQNGLLLGSSRDLAGNLRSLFLLRSTAIQILQVSLGRHAFHQPAISVLWRAQSSLLPLVLCFPSEVLDFSEGARGQPKTVKFAKPPSFQHWERPLIYAKLIIVIASDSSRWRVETYVLHTSVVQTLFDSCPALPLLPRLRDSWISHVHRDTSIDVSLKLQFPIDGIHDTRVLLAQFVEHFETIKSLDTYIGDSTPEFSEYLVALGGIAPIPSITCIGIRFPRFLQSSNSNSVLPRPWPFKF